jgi:hypothetical protein
MTKHNKSSANVQPLAGDGPSLDISRVMSMSLPSHNFLTVLHRIKTVGRHSQMVLLAKENQQNSRKSFDN